MSKSTTNGAKGATTSKADTKVEAKAETTAESTPAKADDAAAPAEKSTKGVAAAAHSPSYFSSVSSAEYRAGWDSVFSSGKKRKKA